MSGSESSQTTPPRSREEMLAQAAKVAEEMQKQYPDLDLTSGWWKPAINLSADSQERLDDETRKKLEACLTKVLDQKYEPDALEEARTEGRKYFTGNEDMLERFDAIFRNREAWAAMNKWAVTDAGKPNEPSGGV